MPSTSARVDLGLGLEQLATSPPGASRSRVLAPSSVPRVADLGQRLRAPAGAGACRAAARSARACRSTVATRQRLGELRRAREHAALVVDTSECPSKTSSSWPPTRLQNATAREVVARALDQHPLALRRPCRAWYGRGRGVDDQRRAGQRLVGAGGPGTQMSSQIVRPMRALAEVEHRAAVAGLEVALLVEHAVVRQPRLAVDAPAISPSASTASAL